MLIYTYKTKLAPLREISKTQIWRIFHFNFTSFRVTKYVSELVLNSLYGSYFI